ncbi:MAG: rRNA maturation RNase YbeY [Clostridia bacterium]|nr:rRNA maturation RNase YbeY [Clostridia bacterium]
MKSKIQIDMDEQIIEFVKSKTDNQEFNFEDTVYKIVENVLSEQNIFAEIVDVSIQSASVEEIRKINHQYRNIDRATDVLSFPIFTKDELRNIDVNMKEVELGDIILCLEVVEKQSIEYHTGILREILYMITHGLCHLTGHDHETDEEKKEMRALEEKVLSKVGVGRVNEE